MRRHPTAAVFVISLAIGLAAGLSYAWLAAPTPPADRTPAHLNDVDRELYVRLVAGSYFATSDRDAAARRLSALGENGPAELVDLIAADLQGDTPSANISALAALAAALQIDDPVAQLLAPAQPLPPATAQPLPTPESTAEVIDSEAGNRFTLVERSVICEPGAPVRRIEVIAQDEAGRPLPGTAVTVRWESGIDEFVTGFAAGRSAGYADFEMEPGVSYALAIAGDEPSADDLQVQFCPDGQDGGWRLEYQAQEP